MGLWEPDLKNAEIPNLLGGVTLTTAASAAPSQSSHAPAQAPKTVDPSDFADFPEDYDYSDYLTAPEDQDYSSASLDQVWVSTPITPAEYYLGGYNEEGEPVDMYGRTDQQITKDYNSFMRSRAVYDLHSLSSLLPEGLEAYSINRRVFEICSPWDQPLPEELQCLEGTTVVEYQGELKTPEYDQNFRITWKDVTKPKSCEAILTEINPKLTKDVELPREFAYVKPCTDEEDTGFVFFIPKTHLKEILPYSLMMSRSKIKCLEYYTLPLTINHTIYLSIAQTVPNATRYQGTSVTPIFSQFQPDFTEVIYGVLETWITEEIIPDPSYFVTSNGETLTFKHTRVEDIE